MADPPPSDLPAQWSGKIRRSELKSHLPHVPVNDGAWLVLGHEIGWIGVGAYALQPQTLVPHGLLGPCPPPRCASTYQDPSSGKSLDMRCCLYTRQPSTRRPCPCTSPGARVLRSCPSWSRITLLRLSSRPPLAASWARPSITSHAPSWPLRWLTFLSFGIPPNLSPRTSRSRHPWWGPLFSPRKASLKVSAHFLWRLHSAFVGRDMLRHNSFTGYRMSGRSWAK